MFKLVFIHSSLYMHLKHVGRVNGTYHSPLTRAVTWSLPVPMRFRTSQTNVVLTASSTFRTFSSFPEITTVSGFSPDILQGPQTKGAIRPLFLVCITSHLAVVIEGKFQLKHPFIHTADGKTTNVASQDGANSNTHVFQSTESGMGFAVAWQVSTTLVRPKYQLLS